ncbi:MAG: NapC/NirT family cytochrome c [Pyrinomonadaceae bacterium]
MSEDKEDVVNGEEEKETVSEESTAKTPDEEKTEEATGEDSGKTVKVPGLFRNYISFAGAAIAAAALISIVLLFLIELSGSSDQPYLGILIYVLFPAVMIFGFLVILAGMLWERRRRRKLTPEEIAAYPIFDFNHPRRRRALLVFLVGSFIFLFLSAFGSYQAYEFSESVTFCGEVCHTVMRPEFVAYNASSHARVRCVECHVGGGAEWYVRSKFSGVRQLYRVLTDTYNKPIQTPVHNMRPANETCGKCHWPEKFYGDQLKVFNHYGFDEKNSLNQTRMLVKVGGGDPTAGQATGIHWHMNLGNEITYIASDEKRQNIQWVRMKGADGQVTEYTLKGLQFSSEQIEQASKRKMDCIDCHNRPTHVYLPPTRAIDDSLTAGRIDVSLPFVKLKGVEVLSKPYNTTEEALSGIAADLDNYYKTSHADIYTSKRDSINRAVLEIQRIYSTYFFPEMKTDWQAHINNIGHYNAQGCFRCHDGQHFSPEGKTIRNECNICHTTLDQKFGGQTFVPEDGQFRHPVNLGDRNTFQCAVCHKGNRAFQHPVNLGDISKFQCAECHNKGF